MLKSHVRPSGELRNNYPQMVDLLKEQDHIIITRNGKGEAVLIGMEVYEKFEAFVHAEYVARKLAEAEACSAKPDAIRYTMDEIRERLGLRK